MRIDGAELRCRVVGEGGNLGFTQKGRIEYALSGGRLNTDAIDNVAGVNCSDHEVNLKILLDAAVADGELTTSQRNELLVALTDAVAKRVLGESYAQALALSLERAQAWELLDLDARLIDDLDRRGQLDRELEELPREEDIRERKAANEGLTGPELSVLLDRGRDGSSPLMGSTRPPHRSQRALLAHWAPPLGSSVEAGVGPGMDDLRYW